jgi:nitroreductase
MNVEELIHDRESIRDYDPARPVAPDVLRRILEAGRVAPSAANRQPWRFLLVSAGAMLDKVKRCYDRQWFRDAPHVLIVVGNRDAAWVRAKDGYNAVETDATIALDHMILAAEHEGVGTCWIAAFDPAVLRDALQLSGNEQVFALTPLGDPASASYATRSPPASSLTRAEVVRHFQHQTIIRGRMQQWTVHLAEPHIRLTVVVRLRMRPREVQG